MLVALHISSYNAMADQSILYSYGQFHNRKETDIFRKCSQFFFFRMLEVSGFILHVPSFYLLYGYKSKHSSLVARIAF